MSVYSCHRLASHGLASQLAWRAMQPQPAGQWLQPRPLPACNWPIPAAAYPSASQPCSPA